MSDYLAVILIGSGSSYGRDPDLMTAVQLAMSSYHDWESVFVMSEHNVPVNVWNVAGYSDCHWDHRGMHAKNEKTGEVETLDFKSKCEIVKRHFVPRKKRRKA
jgi:hypothetical protein